MSALDYEFDTLKVRGGYNPKEHNNSVSVPIYATASFEFGSTERLKRLKAYLETGYVYSRVANPTVSVLEQRIAQLHGAAAAIAVGSGMAAITYTLLNLAERGGRILTSIELYGGTVDGLKKLFPNWGIKIDVVKNPRNLEEFEEAIKPDTKAIYMESISNPNAAVADIEALAKIAHKNNIPLIIDNTLATPYLLNPIKYGADIVVYSATKAISGHGNVIAGLIVENGSFNWSNDKFKHFLEPYYTLRDRNNTRRNFIEVFPKFPFTARIRSNYLTYLGATLSPFDAYFVLLGLETLSERVKKQVDNAEKIVEYLQTKNEVAWVNYPTAEESVYKQLANKYLPKGAGSIFSFGINGTEERIDKFIDALKLFSYQANIGDAKSLVVNPPRTTHSELTPEEQKLANIPPETIRLSIGLEDSKDLIEDLEQAFDIAFNK